jgi:hypothetical protein
MKRIGPELKMPKLKRSGGKASSFKAPPWAADVYNDLRDRRLLPLVALVVVAIVAVPFLLGSSEEPVPPPVTADSAAEEAALEVTGAPTLTVVEAKPGLRDYRKRLRGRTPTDPFKQRYTGLPDGAELESTVETSPTGSGEESTEISITESGGDVTEVEIDTPGSAPGTGGSPGAPAPDGGQFYAFRPDVRFGLAGSGELREYDDLPLASLLPKESPLLIFIGVTEDGKRAVFDVGSEVIFVKGEGKCVGGRQSCGLLFLGEEQAVTLLTEARGRTFQLAVDSIDFVPVDPPVKAGSSAVEAAAMPGFTQNFTK